MTYFWVLLLLWPDGRSSRWSTSSDPDDASCSVTEPVTREGQFSKTGGLGHCAYLPRHRVRVRHVVAT